MKTICTLMILFVLGHNTFAQSVSTSGNIAADLPTGGTRNWTVGATTSTASGMNNGNPLTTYLFIRGFDFSSLPTNISVTSLTVTFTRSADATITDNEVRLVLAGTVYTGANSNAAAVPTTWPATPTANTYTFPAAALALLTTNDLQNANFGVAISAQRTAGSNLNATVANTATINMTYITLAPLILTNFTVSKNADNQVDIRFSTATEENVEHIYIERSSDGLVFEKIFTIAPRGAKNVYSHYALTDKAPVQGNNYYRITEIDKNGRWAYYMTKMVNISRAGSAFAAYFNGSQVVAQISNTPGSYTLSIADLSGATIARQQVNMNGKSATVTLPSPARAGVYIIVLSGQGVHETVRLAIRK